MSKKKTAPTEGNNFEQIATISPTTGLTPQQEQACILLASGESYTATAERLGVNRCTLYKWQDCKPFQRYYKKQVCIYQTEVKNAIWGLHSEAIRTIKEMLASGGEATRLKASIWLLEKILPSGIESTFGELDVKFEIMPTKEPEKVLTL